LKPGGEARQPRSVSVRIGSGDSTGGLPGPTARTGAWATGAWTLRLAPFLLVPPIVLSLASGRPRQALAGLGAIALTLVASGVMQRGLAQAAAYEARTVAKAPRPLKLLAGLGTAAAAFLFAGWGTDDGLLGFGPGPSLLEAAVFGLLAFVGCRLAYGPDPRGDKGLGAELAARSGLRTEQVVAAIAEAEAKLHEIELAGRDLRSAELKARLRRIVDQGRAILQQLERDPRDLSRARRFLVTYLDGTRDVVRKYAAQERDVADTPLGDSFRRVLTTIEQVFLEQEEVLKRHDALDLDVQIEVLEMQLKREGVV
jgi:hypothetical protein